MATLSVLSNKNKKTSRCAMFACLASIQSTHKSTAVGRCVCVWHRVEGETTSNHGVVSTGFPACCCCVCSSSH